MKRRTALKGIAWSAPSAVVVTAAPAVATSLLESRIRFTNVTATVGKTTRTVYANTRVQVVDGPDPVNSLVLTITVSGHEPRLWTWDQISGWGNTEQQHDEWAMPTGTTGPITVTFTATADGVEPISSTVQLEAPGWWS